MAIPLRRTWTVTERVIPHGEPLPDAEVRSRIETGVAALAETGCVGPASRIAIAFDDLSRPTPTARLMPALTDALEAHGVEPVRLTLICAVGGHRPLSREEFVQKLGERAVSRYLTLNHHPHENLVDLGTSARGTPIRLNRDFVEADVRLVVGGVLPHPYMGYGGGAKMVLPGLSGIESLEANHRSVLRGLSGGLLELDGNEARADVEEIAAGVGVHLALQAVVDPRRALIGLEVGDVVTAHRRAAALAGETYRLPTPDGEYDVIVVGAYPKDREQYQLGNVFNAIRSSGRTLLAAGGSFVIVGRCSDGLGYHGLQGHGMRLHRTPTRGPGFQAGREIVVFSPGLTKAGLAFSFHEGAELAQTAGELTAILGRRHGAEARVLVVPSGPLSILTRRSPVGASG